MPKYKICIAESSSEAWDMILGGFFWFVKNRTLITCLAIAVTVGSPGYLAIELYTTDRTKVEAITKPLLASPGGWVQKQNEKLSGLPIIIKGQIWAYSDPDYQCWKLTDVDAILVLHKPSGYVTKVEMPHRTFRK